MAGDADMTAIAVSAAVSVFLSYAIRRSAGPDDEFRNRVATLLKIVSLVLVATYFYLRLTGS